MNAGLDLMDFISKSDFSTVNGGKPVAVANNDFDFFNGSSAA